jgi:hypothetical protein
MKPKKIILFVLILIFLIAILQFVLSSGPQGDQVLSTSRINEAQKALDVQGFNAKTSIAGFSNGVFSDSVNPVNGALSITQTDSVISGRNGMDVALTRAYNSNVFLNINQGPFNFNCESNNNSITCPNCQTPKTLDSRDMKSCSIQDGDSASFKREKYLGTGWTLNYEENVLRDVTPLVYETVDGKVSNTFKYISARGINSISLNGQDLILPSMFASNFDLFGSNNFKTEGNFLWSYDLAFTRGLTSLQVSSLLNSLHNFDPYSILTQTQIDPIALAQNYFIGETGAGKIGGFAAYTDALEPVQIWHNVNTIYPGAIQTIANYKTKDGRTYAYGNQVNFCDKFDDMLNTSGGHCDTNSLTELQAEKVFNWAENPYAGTYLTDISDTFGNNIHINYFGQSSDYGMSTKSPFIDTIYTPGVTKPIQFIFDSDYSTVPSALNLDSKLYSINVPSSRDSSYNKMKYTYTNINGANLLQSVELFDSSSNSIAGTKYVYGYDQNTRELTSVTLPTGATITYTYAWENSIPAYDPLRIDYQPYVGVNLDKMPRRVVKTRTITNGGVCNTPTCTWTYDYQSSAVPVNSHYTITTTVTDPFGNKVVTEAYATTSPTLSYNQ